MTKHITILSGALVVLLAACATQDVRQTLKNNPEIIFQAIQENPEKFYEAANSAYNVAKGKEQAEAKKREMASKEEEFKHPARPEVSESRAIRGKADAQVVIVAYSDFQCPFCKVGKDTLVQLQEKYGDKVAILHKHLPLDFHKEALPAAKYFEAIAQQNKTLAYKFHDEVYDHQGELSKDGKKYLDKVVAGLKIDMAKFKKDLASKTVEANIKSDTAEASKFGIYGTPGFLVGGIKVSGAQPIEMFEAIINRRLQQAEATKAEPNKG